MLNFVSKGIHFLQHISVQLNKNVSVSYLSKQSCCHGLRLKCARYFCHSSHSPEAILTSWIVESGISWQNATVWNL